MPYYQLSKILGLSLVLFLAGCRSSKPIVTQSAPFSNLDTLAINDWWKRGKNPIIDMKVERDEVIAFGIYTVSNRTLKLSAQFYPLYPEESRIAHLEVMKNGKWKQIASAKIHDLGWSAAFKIVKWDDTKDTPYRLRHGKRAEYKGVIRRNPVDKAEIVMVAMSCNSNKDRGMREEYIHNINHHNPDILFFAGDQSYDHREHTAAWLKWGLQFRELFRSRPCITIPDDHDIGQGNLWGENGKKAKRTQGDDGGYFYHHEYIKMVERCQTSHLPDPYDPRTIEQGIEVYYTNLVLGGVDFAIIEDRKFKSGPMGKIPQQGPRPDHIRNPDYDPSSVDVPGLKLLGDRQLSFLEAWSTDTADVAMKAVLSQTGFCGGAHIHGQLENRLHADMDSGGWPQSGRNQALQLIQAANAVHIAGDQHLATVIKHGITDYGDGPWAFVVPAIVNNYYSRWWWPQDETAGGNYNNDNPLPWTGDYRDGFDNRITMHAYANPDGPSSGAGYGLIRFDKAQREVTFECWPRYSDVTKPEAEQFVGWPVVVQM